LKNQVHPKFFFTRRERELASLRELSARVGSDPLLVQASNGNTSIKLEGILWIKGSGKWLARANQEEVLIPIELGEAKETVEQGGEIAQRQISRNGMRPSIETAMHAVLPHRVVIHVHSINTIAWAIRSDGIEEVTARLRGLHWQWIPYAASGIPLAREIELAVARAKDTDVFILANHGLVVCGEDCAAAEELLREVERRLAISPRPFPMPDSAVLGNIARFSGWQYPEYDSLHALGTDKAALKILKGGVLYPCQAIFLGLEALTLAPTLAASKLKARLTAGEPPSFVVVERSGVMLNEKMTGAERATLIGLMEVVRRTKESARLRYLTREEVEKVVNQGGRGYRDEAETEERANSATAGGDLRPGTRSRVHPQHALFMVAGERK
jgi:rhamnose utilization protein RhaD (predicted bifunctional aldolase and dehydrogenase)